MRCARSRRPCGGDRVLPGATGSTSSWSARRRRSAPASSTTSKRPASRRSGRRKAAARLEGSKGFTKDLCRANDIPTAAYERFTRRRAGQGLCARTAARRSWSRPTGLPPARASWWRKTVAEAEAAIDMMFGGGLGEAGAEVVIEEFLDGEEASFFALCDGDTAIAARHRAGPQARLRRRSRARTPAAWAPIRRRRMIDAAMSARVMDEIVAADAARHEGDGRAVQGRAVCRADDHAPRARS